MEELIDVYFKYLKETDNLKKKNLPLKIKHKTS